MPDDNEQDLFDEEDVADGGDAEGEAPAEAPPPEAAAPPDTGDAANVIQQASEAIAELGLEVPPDTQDPLEFLRHVITSAKTHKSTKEKVMSEQAQPQSGMPGEQPTQEQQPYLMATDGERIYLSTIVTTPLERFHDDQRLMAAAIQKDHQAKLKIQLTAERQKGATLLSAVAKLERRGIQPPDAKRIRDLVGEPKGYQLSTDGESRAKKLRRAEYELGVINRYLPGFTKELLLSAHVEPHPAGVTPAQDDDDYMVRMAGLTPKK